MNVYKFETFHEFGYCRDPHKVFLIVRKDMRGCQEYEVTDGHKEVPKSDFKAYPTWERLLNTTGEVYFEVYSKDKGMLGVIKIEKFETID